MYIKSGIVIVFIGILAWLLFGFLGVQALFMDQTVNEEVPAVAMGSAQPSLIDTPSQTTSTKTGENPRPGVEQTATRTPRIIAQGTFQQGDTTYSIHGEAVVTEENGVRTLSLVNFDVTNGPDLFVYITNAQGTDNLTVKEAVRNHQFTLLRTLKGNRGNQTYTIPEDVKLDGQSLVTIWCRRFSRHFGSAPLEMK